MLLAWAALGLDCGLSQGEWQESGVEQPEGKQVGCQHAAQCYWWNEEAWAWGLHL